MEKMADWQEIYPLIKWATDPVAALGLAEANDGGKRFRA
jgi:hypothetical protein